MANAAFGSGSTGKHTIGDDRDFAAHLDYTHFNPVKYGLVKHPADWPHSSFRQCVASGLYPAGWIGGNKEPLETGAALTEVAECAPLFRPTFA